jgi:hypothetical protein
MEALAFTVATLENPSKLVPVLEAMGRRHVTYGPSCKDLRSRDSFPLLSIHCSTIRVHLCPRLVSAFSLSRFSL